MRNDGAKLRRFLAIEIPNDSATFRFSGGSAPAAGTGCS